MRKVNQKKVLLKGVEKLGSYIIIHTKAANIYLKHLFHVRARASSPWKMEQFNPTLQFLL